MPAHFKSMFGEAEPTSVAAMVRKNLGLERDDDLDDHSTWRDAADEAQARLSILRDREGNEEKDSTPTPEELESVCRPLHHYLAKMRHSGESASEDDDLRHKPDGTGDEPRRGDYVSEGENGRRRDRVEHVDLSEEEMQRRGSSGDFRGCVASHFRRS